MLISSRHKWQHSSMLQAFEVERRTSGRAGLVRFDSIDKMVRPHPNILWLLIFFRQACLAAVRWIAIQPVTGQQWAEQLFLFVGHYLITMFSS